MTRGDTELDIAWTAPADNGCGITGYMITNSSDGTSREVAGTSTVWTGLTNGSGYSFTVRAANELGWSPESAPSASVIPAGVPICGSSSLAAAASAPGEITVTWTGVIDNGSPITGYDLGAGAPADVGADGNLAWTATGLANGTGYDYTLRATNDVGTSPVCASASATTWDLPTPVDATLTFDPDAEQVTIAVIGGISTTPPVLDYAYTWSMPSRAIGSTGNGDVPRTFVESHGGEGIHSFSLRVCNAVGCVETTPGCCQIDIVLASPPDQMAPPVMRSVEDHGQANGINVYSQANAPADNGAPITSYEWEGRYSGSSGQWHDMDWLGPTTNLNEINIATWPAYTNINHASAVTFQTRARAINDQGAGPWSDWGSVTPGLMEPNVWIGEEYPETCWDQQQDVPAVCVEAHIRVSGFGISTTHRFEVIASTPPEVAYCDNPIEQWFETDNRGYSSYAGRCHLVVPGEPWFPVALDVWIGSYKFVVTVSFP